MKKNNLIIVAVIVFSALFLFTLSGCDSSDPAGESTGGVTAFSDCGGYPDPGMLLKAFNFDGDFERECDKTYLFYELRGNKLLLKRLNCGFNCCPGTLLADITVSGNVINIVEKEDDGAMKCHCNCLFDMEIEIENVSPMTYTLKISEPLAPETNDPIEITLNLATAPTGSAEFYRGYYPWCEDGE